MEEDPKMSTFRTRAMMSAAAVSVALLALAGCSQTEPGASNSPKTAIRLAGVVANATDPYWITVMCGADAEAAKSNVALKWYTSPTTSAESMSQSFSSATLADPQGIFLSPFQAAQFSTQVAGLMKKGVPVVASTPLDPATEYSDIPLATEGTHFVGQFMKLLPSGSGSIVALGGVTGIPPLDEEWKPLEAAVQQQRSDVTVLPTEYTNFDVTKSTQIVSGLLLAHPDLSVIIASTGPEGQGAAAAVQQAGKAGKVKIWAYDAVPAEVSALRAGVITVLAAKPARAVGAKAVDLLVSAIRKDPTHRALAALSPTTASLPLTVITKSNIDSAAAKAAMYVQTCGS